MKGLLFALLKQQILFNYHVIKGLLSAFITVTLIKRVLLTYCHFIWKFIVDIFLKFAEIIQQTVANNNLSGLFCFILNMQHEVYKSLNSPYKVVEFMACAVLLLFF